MKHLIEVNGVHVNRVRGISISYDNNGNIVDLITPHGDCEPYNKPINS
jgi:hypothetical protein